MNNNDAAAAFLGFIIIAVVIGGYIALVILGVRTAKRKNRSPHWMWFGLHPVGLIIVLIVLASVGPLKECPRCAQKAKAYARLCAYCGTALADFAPPPQAQQFPQVFPQTNASFPTVAPPPPPPPPPPAHAQAQAQAGDMVMSDTQMADVLSRLCNAYTANDRIEIARLEPIASQVGQELHRRGGIEEMRRMWNRLGNMRGSRTLDMHWDGIGDWRG